MTTQRIAIYALLTLLTITQTPELLAQEEVDNNHVTYWLNAGGRLESLNELGVSASCNFSIFNMYAQALYSGQRFSIENSYGYYNTRIAAVGIGESLNKRFLMISGFIGPSWVWGRDSHSTSSEHFSTPGLNINMQMYFKPVYDMGLGIELIQNYTKLRMFTAVNFTAAIIIK